ncbi:MAG: bifunctional oligoribonuclease/PAP phosphatase NrnA [Spirochaetes bacterium]|nr:bifunctional oligoribonuclease/PAP phosphatase NrnA [Spirochaetota bacterium]
MDYFANLKKYLNSYDQFIISTHESPDPDGLGAEIAFKELLFKIGKKAIIINSDPTPSKFNFIDPDNEIIIFNENLNINNLNDYAVFVLDTNDFDNIGKTYQYIKNYIKDVFIIDHHEGGQDKMDANFIKVEASSTSEIIGNILQHFGIIPSFKAAQALYAGIVFDTGCFKYPKTSPVTFVLAAQLLSLGVRPYEIYQRIYENNSLEVFRLRALMLASMEVHFGGKLILMKLTPDMIKETNAPFSEGEVNINLPLTVEGVVASVLVKQDIGGPVKVSMRTKGDLDVAEIAIANGGGGHKNAAGYKSVYDFETTRLKVLEEMSRFFK